MVDMIDRELRQSDRQAGAARLLDFLSSVCRTEERGHERMQIRTAQLLCGLVSEGADPHLSRLLYHLRLVAEPDSLGGSRGTGGSPGGSLGGSLGRLRAVEVQISTCTYGKSRPAYRVEDGEAGEEDVTYDESDDDPHRTAARLADELEEGTSADEATAGTWADLIEWLPHEELRRGGHAHRQHAHRQHAHGGHWDGRGVHAEGHWVRVDGRRADGLPTTDGEVAYLRAQLRLFAHLAYGRNLKTTDTLIEVTEHACMSARTHEHTHA